MSTDSDSGKTVMSIHGRTVIIPSKKPNNGTFQPYQTETGTLVTHPGSLVTIHGWEIVATKREWFEAFVRKVFLIYYGEAMTAWGNFRTSGGSKVFDLRLHIEGARPDLPGLPVTLTYEEMEQLMEDLHRAYGAVYGEKDWLALYDDTYLSACHAKANPTEETRAHWAQDFLGGQIELLETTDDDNTADFLMQALGQLFS